MDDKTTENKANSHLFDYLCVDDFIKDITGARFLETAFEIGLIDFLDKNRSYRRNEIKGRFFGKDEKGANMFLDILITIQVLEEQDGDMKFSGPFLKALKYRDLLESKLRFSNFLSRDFTDLFTPLMVNSEYFLKHARVFDMFGYNRCFENTCENYELTKRWMQITTALTRYESRVCMEYHDFSSYTRILDIGGNSGEFGLQICRRFPEARVTVFDLPLVCDVGQEHLKDEPEAERISFVRGNALTDPLSQGFDLVIFKSMLHDWPEKQTVQLIHRAAESLCSDGCLLIFEREELNFQDMTPPFSMIPFLLFFRSFRPSNLYENYLHESGLKDIDIKHIQLETAFHLITAKK